MFDYELQQPLSSFPSSNYLYRLKTTTPWHYGQRGGRPPRWRGIPTEWGPRSDGFRNPSRQWQKCSRVATSFVNSVCGPRHIVQVTYSLTYFAQQPLDVLGHELGPNNPAPIPVHAAVRPQLGREELV